MARLHEQIAVLRQDNARLRGDLDQAQVDLQQAQTQLQQVRSEPQEGVSDQAVMLLSQAQQLADQLIDEGMQSARDLLQAARTHQRDIIDPTVDEADLGAHRPLPANGDAAGPPDALSAEVEDVRMFAKVAQVQFRAVLESLNEQVNRLGQFSDNGDKARPDSDPGAQPAPPAAANGHRA